MVTAPAAAWEAVPVQATRTDTWPQGGVYLAVGQHLHQPFAVAVDAGVATVLAFVKQQRVVARLQQRARLLDCRGDDVVHVERFARERHQPAGDARDVQQVVHQAGHVLHLAANDGAGAAHLLGVEARQRQQVGGRADRCERIAQFVGQHGQEFIFLAVRRQQRLFGPRALERVPGAFGNVDDQRDIVRAPPPGLVMADIEIGAQQSPAHQRHDDDRLQAYRRIGIGHGGKARVKPEVFDNNGGALRQRRQQGRAELGGVPASRQAGQCTGAQPLVWNAELACILVDFGKKSARDGQVALRHLGGGNHRAVSAGLAAQAVGQLQLKRLAPLAGHARGRLDGGGEHPVDDAVAVTDRAVRKREVAQFQIAIAVEHERHVVALHGGAVLHQLLDHRPDGGPYVGPGFPCGPSECIRMLGLAQDRTVAIVVELNQVRSPPYGDREW
jgi:hypothetical protein